MQGEKSGRKSACILLNLDRTKIFLLKKALSDVLFFCFSFRRVRAIYDCVAEGDGELSFNKGAIISNGN